MEQESPTSKHDGGTQCHVNDQYSVFPKTQKALDRLPDRLCWHVLSAQQLHVLSSNQCSRFQSSYLG